MVPIVELCVREPRELIAAVRLNRVDGPPKSEEPESDGMSAGEGEREGSR